MTAPWGAEEVPDTEFGRQMDDRRNDLGLTWDDVADRSGLSRQTLYDLRKGKTDYTRMRSSTRRKLEKALEWELGSVERAVLEGVNPRPARPAVPAPELLAHVEEADRLVEAIRGVLNLQGKKMTPRMVEVFLAELGRQITSDPDVKDQ